MRPPPYQIIKLGRGRFRVMQVSYEDHGAGSMRCDREAGMIAREDRADPPRVTSQVVWRAKPLDGRDEQVFRQRDKAAIWLAWGDQFVSPCDRVEAR